MGNGQYTHDMIPGKAPSVMLPQGCSLVLEGGGTRGFYTAGVFEAFMDVGIMFPYIAAVSAGVANAISYISGQQNRNRQVLEYYVGKKQYVSKRNLLFHRSLFNMDYIFHTVPQKHIPLDWQMFHEQDVRFLAGAVDCETGKTVWFEKQEMTPQMETAIASCSMPVVSKIVRYRNYSLLDGGVADPIPIEKSVQDQNQFHVIILTRNKGYSKDEFKHPNLLKLIYRHYPEMVDAIINRHETYNRQLALCEQLEKEGKAIIIRPQKPLEVDRVAANIPKLLALHDEGCAEGREAVEKIMRRI